MVLTSARDFLPEPTGSLRIPAIAPQLRLSLIIPTYNERSNLAALIQALTDTLDPLLPHQYELIVVDDNSPDGTWQLAQQLAETYPALRVLRRTLETGLSTAVVRGWQVASGELLGVIDGDLQHPPEVLAGMVKAVSQGADLAVASRHVAGGGVSEWSLLRRLLSRGAQVLGLVLLPGVVGRVSDPMSGYFMVQRRAISGRKLNPLGYKILLEVLGRGRIDRIAEVGYVFQERGEGQSKVTWRQYRDYLRHLVRLRLSLKGGAQTVRRPWPKLRRLSRFGLVGLSGVGIDMACLHWLLESLGLPLNLAAVLAAEVAIANNFLWNDRWTFRDLAQAQTQRGQLARRFLKFNLICLCGVGLKVMLLGAMVANLGWNPYLANLVAIAIVTAWNFWINLKLNWRVTQLSR